MDRIESKAERPDKPVGGGRTASRFDLVLDTVGRLLRRGAIGNLERMVSKMHPADVAKMLHHLNAAQEKRTIFESASASSVFGTATRTISQPALASAATCAVVASTSCVFVVVIDCTTTGAPPPILTPPTEICRLLAIRGSV